jgi:hypothetical protein
MTAVNFGLSTSDPATTYNHALQRQIWESLACWSRTSSHFGEHNLYSKDHQRALSIDRVPVHIPVAVKEAKFTKYKLQELNGEGDLIRLLELLPRTWSKSPDFIACRLVIKWLSEDPKYEALSYTWGTLARDIPIFVVPSPLPHDLVVSEALLVTASLYAALRKLRREQVSRFLWVDQMCIDQSNNTERGEQVLLMDKIYEQSTQTIIWLGKKMSTVLRLKRCLDFSWQMSRILKRMLRSSKSCLLLIMAWANADKMPSHTC